MRSETPKWVKAIPESQAHGSGTLQKRLWRLVSDYVRIRDWHAFKGLCVATGKYISDWRSGDAGHYIPFSVCNGLFKFSIINIHLQSKKDNAWGGAETGHSFGEELKGRYGEGFIIYLKESNRTSPLKFTTANIIQEMRNIISKMETLPEQPTYYKRVVSLMGHEK